MNGTESLYDSISKNKLKLFRHRNDVAVTKKSQEINSLKSDCCLYGNLYIACQARKGDLEELLVNENHSYPPAISEYGKLRKCNDKSDFLGCIKEFHEPSRANPTVECSVIDGAAFVNVHQPRTSKNFGEYCKQEIKQNISYTLGQASYVDLVFDVYRDITTKGATRAGRGKGVRVSVRNDTPIGKFKDFMRVGDNKKELFNMIADTIPSIQSNTLLIATKNEHVVSNKDINSSRLEMCTHEEADS